MKKSLTDDQLEEMGRKLSQMHKDAISLWALSMKSMPIQSREYRKICATGKAIQGTYFMFREIAFTRGWSDSRINEAFNSDSYCSFS